MIIAILLISFYSSASTKQEVYYNSCYGSYLSMATNISKTSTQEKIRSSAKMLCGDAKEHWSKLGWDKVKLPMYQGCVNATELMYEPDLDPKIRKSNVDWLQKNYCLKIGMR